MKATVYLRKDCPNCGEVDFYEDINITKVYVDSEEYEGHLPEQVPCMQFKHIPGFNLTGAWYINNFIDVMRECQDGLWRK